MACRSVWSAGKGEVLFLRVEFISSRFSPDGIYHLCVACVPAQPGGLKPLI